MLLAIDLFVYLALLVLMSCELGFREDSLGIVSFWSLLAISLTVALCLALRRVRKYSAGFSNNSGMQASKNLLLAHQSSFIAGATLNCLAFLLDTILILGTKQNKIGPLGNLRF